jgi:hypothetical protein
LVWQPLKGRQNHAAHSIEQPVASHGLSLVKW